MGAIGGDRLSGVIDLESLRESCRSFGGVRFREDAPLCRPTSLAGDGEAPGREFDDVLLESARFLYTEVGNKLETVEVSESSLSSSSSSSEDENARLSAGATNRLRASLYVGLAGAVVSKDLRGLPGWLGGGVRCPADGPGTVYLCFVSC